MAKVEALIGSNLLSAELLSKNEFILRISENDEPKTCIFEGIINFQALSNELKYLFANIEDFYDVISRVINQPNNKNVVIESSGKIHISLEVKVYAKIHIKTASFSLQKQLKGDEQINVLRGNLQLAQRQIKELKSQINAVAEENNQLKLKFQYLEQIVLMQTIKKGGAQQNDSKYGKTKSPKKVEVAPVQPNKQTQKKEAPKVQQQDQQLPTQGPLKLDFDPNCMYYNKYTFQNNKITSLYEDYYQIYLKDPLPNKGIFRTKLKMLAENHLSFGVLGKSALHNQYSFQNSKAICLYSYFYGNFRGIYYRTKYQPLDWIIHLGEVIEIQLNMTNKTLKLKIEGQKTAQLIKFQDLFNEQPLYFFIQMYQKGNVVQFIQ